MNSLYCEITVLIVTWHPHLRRCCQPQWTFEWSWNGLGKYAVLHSANKVAINFVDWECLCREDRGDCMITLAPSSIFWPVRTRISFTQLLLAGDSELVKVVHEAWSIQGPLGLHSVRWRLAVWCGVVVTVTLRTYILAQLQDICRCEARCCHQSKD